MGNEGGGSDFMPTVSLALCKVFFGSIYNLQGPPAELPGQSYEVADVRGGASLPLKSACVWLASRNKQYDGGSSRSVQGKTRKRWQKAARGQARLAALGGGEEGCGDIRHASRDQKASREEARRDLAVSHKRTDKWQGRGLQHFGLVVGR